jgi:hypothetical protein
VTGRPSTAPVRLTAAAVSTSLLAILSLVVGLLGPPAVRANTSHEGWPQITGMLLMNRTDSARPLDARPGFDPFAGKDPTYSCDEVNKLGRCQAFMVPCDDAGAQAGRCPLGGRMVADDRVHDELLGAHGSDTIHGGPSGDVIWADHKPHGPTGQVDEVYGGGGNDFIYASHGRNYVDSGPGDDRIHAHFGRGEIRCGSRGTVVYMSRRSRPRYRLVGCARISYKTVGY